MLEPGAVQERPVRRAEILHPDAVLARLEPGVTRRRVLVGRDRGMVQRDETFAVVGSGLGSFDASQFGKGIGGSDIPQRGHAVLRLKERKIPSPP